MCTICLERCAGVLVEFVMIVGFLDERWIQLHWAKCPGHVLELFGCREVEGNVDDGNAVFTGGEQSESYNIINKTLVLVTIKLILIVNFRKMND